MSRYILIVMLIGLCQPIASLAQPRCNVAFIVNNAGFEVEGTMQCNCLKIKTNGGYTTAIEGVAYPSTIKTGFSLRDEHLKQEDYFYADRFPEIKMKSTRVTHLHKNKYEAEVELTIKNISHKVIFPFQLKINGESERITGSFTINRLDYMLGEESTILSTLVTIIIEAEHIVAVKAD